MTYFIGYPEQLLSSLSCKLQANKEGVFTPENKEEVALCESYQLRSLSELSEKYLKPKEQVADTLDIMELEVFEAMVQNRTLEQLEQFGEDVDLAVSKLAEDDREAGENMIVEATAEMEGFKTVELEGLEKDVLLRIANGVYGASKPKNTGVKKLTIAITEARAKIEA